MYLFVRIRISSRAGFALQKSYYFVRFSLVVTHCQALKNFLCFVPQLIQKHRYIFGENRVFLKIYYCFPEIYEKFYFICYIFSSKFHVRPHPFHSLCSFTLLRLEGMSV